MYAFLYIVYIESFNIVISKNLFYKIINFIKSLNDVKIY